MVFTAVSIDLGRPGRRAHVDGRAVGSRRHPSGFGDPGAKRDVLEFDEIIDHGVAAPPALSALLEPAFFGLDVEDRPVVDPDRACLKLVRRIGRAARRPPNLVRFERPVHP
jgi:hypothetical protein